MTAAQTPSDGNTQDNTQILDTVIDPNMNGGWGQIYGNVRDGYGGAWQGWEQIATPNAVLDGSQGVPIGSPTWSNIGAEEVWAEAPTFCPT